MREKIGRAGRRTNRTLGTLYARALGLVSGALTLGVGRACLSAFEASMWTAAAVLGVVAFGLGALTLWLFRPGHRLSDLVE